MRCSLLVSSNRSLGRFVSILVWLSVAPAIASGQDNQAAARPSRQEQVQPIHLESLHAREAGQRKQGGHPREIDGVLVFDGAQDGNRQVDPQIAVGPDHVLHGTNGGLTIYDKQGNFVDGVHQSGFNNGIDPKLFFDPHSQVFGFDLWVYWDEAKQKPVNISVSQSSDPTKAWNTYSIPAPEGRDGGAIGFSRNWIGYSFPGGPQQTFVMSFEDCRSGKPVTVYHFDGNLGHPVTTQDPEDDLYFLKLARNRLVISRVTTDDDGQPKVVGVCDVDHGLEYFGRPPQSPQQGTDNKTASGDRNPKNVVLQSGCLWFSHAVDCKGRSAVQWHQVRLDGTRVQSGRIEDPRRSFIQTSLAVNQQQDVLVGFQETGPDMFISPRLAYRKASDPPGTLRPAIALGTGKAATAGGSWGDYSGSTIDGGNRMDLWTVQSIADAEGKGDAVIARVRMEILQSD